MTKQQLLDALNDLDQRLTQKGRSLDIFICGAMAIQLLGLARIEPTNDADSLKPIGDSEILEMIAAVGESHGLPKNWLNDQAASVDVPDGSFERAKPFGNWKSIRAVVMDRADLIKMKAVAFASRRDETMKDWDDLDLLKPSVGEVEAAIEHLRKVASPPKGATKKMIEEFHESVEDLKKLTSK